MITLTTERYDWGYVSGRISALEGRLLSRDFLASLLAQARTEDLMRQLQETPLGGELTPGAAWDDVSAIIDAHYYGIMQSLREDAPDTTPFDIFLASGDFLNLKHALTHDETFPFLPGTLSTDALSNIAAGDWSSISQDLQQALAPIYSEEVPESDRQNLLDVVLDAAYLRHVLRLADAVQAPLITTYVETLVQSRAVMALWRAQRSGRSMRWFRAHFLPLDPFTSVLVELIERGAPAFWSEILHGDMADALKEALELPPDEQAPRFDQRVAQHLNRIAERGRYQAFGPERVFSFLAALTTEAYNMKLIVCGRLNRIDADLLRQRLRDAHA